MDAQERTQVLIVEDEALVGQTIQELLEALGYAVVGRAVNGRQAVEMTQSLQPDVVLMDIGLPDIDGVEATRCINQSCPTPVVVLTAYEIPELVEQATAAGAVAYLVKPADVQEIERAITVAIARFDDLMALRRLNAELQAQIAERKRAEEALRESEEKYRLLVENATVTIVVAQDGMLKFFNPEAMQITGYSQEELASNSFLELIHPDDQEVTVGYYLRFLQGEETPPMYAFRIIDKQGNIRWLESNAVLITWEGRPATLNFISDVTERKQAEEALRASERRFRALTENSADGIALLDAEGAICYESPASLQTLGYSVGELVGTNVLTLIYPDDIQSVSQLLSALVEKPGTPMTIQFRFRHKEGTWCWLEATGNNLLAEPSVQAIVVNYREISERKQAAEALQESEEKHRILFETMTQGVVYQNADGAIFSVNPAAERILGLTLDQMQGRTSMDPRWKALHEDGSDFSGDTHPAMIALATGKAVHDVVMGVFNPELEDYVWININAEPQFRPRETVPYQVYTTFEDITKRKQAEKALQRSLEETARSQRLLLALSQAAQAVQRAHTPDEVYQAIGDEVAKLGYHVVVFTLTDDREHLMISHLTFEPTLLQVVEKLGSVLAMDYLFPMEAGGFYDQLMREGRTIFLPQVLAPLIEMLPRAVRPLAGQILGVLGIEQAIYAPLTVGGEPYSVLFVTGADLTEADAPAVAAFANQAAIALDNARLLEAEREQRELAEALGEAAAAVSRTLDLDEVLDHILEQTQRVVAGDAFSVILISDGEARVARWRGYELPGEETQRLRPEIPMARYPSLMKMVQTGDPVIVSDTSLDPDWIPTEIDWQWRRSYVGAPIQLGGVTVGFLGVSGARPGQFGPKDGRRLEAFASHTAAAIENARLFEAERTTREQLRDLTNYLQKAREEERAHISREIHDEFGQALTALKMDLSWLIRRLPADEPSLAGKANTMSDLIDDTMRKVRHVATELRPGLLDDLGLAAAIEWQTQEFAERTEIDCELYVSQAEITLDRDLATAIFRILQETLTNVARHAEATEVRVELQVGPDELALVIRDNGRGITESHASDPASLGLIGMRERARSWGGDVTFEGVPGQGTTVTVRMPRLNPEESRK